MSADKVFLPVCIWDTSLFHSLPVAFPLVLDVDTQCWGAETGISWGLVARQPDQEVLLKDYFKDKAENNRKRNSKRLLAPRECGPGLDDARPEGRPTEGRLVTEKNNKETERRGSRKWLCQHEDMDTFCQAEMPCSRCLFSVFSLMSGSNAIKFFYTVRFPNDWHIRSHVSNTSVLNITPSLWLLLSRNKMKGTGQTVTCFPFPVRILLTIRFSYISLKICLWGWYVSQH